MNYVIKKRHLSWFGRVSRMSDDSLVKRCMKEEFVETRKRGRPEKRWQDIIREDTGLPLVRQNAMHKWAKPPAEVW